MEFTKSIKEYYVAQSLIVGGVKKMNKLGPIEKFPIYFSRAKGSVVWDIDGNEYVDFISGKGAIILGYANDEVNRQVVNQINMSNFMPLSNPIQNELAKIINEKIPCAERVRFFRTGSCAASALIRLARAYTKKEIILTSGYHGWHDTFTGGRNGVLTENSNYTLDFQYNVDRLEKFLVKYSGSVAAIFITPEPCFFGKEFYEECFYLSRKYHTLFLFDEIKTGFRTSLEGFQSKIGIIPDAATFSKAMGNGYAISAVAGFEKLMFAEEETHLSGTFDTEASSISASIRTIELLEKYNVASYIENLGRYFAEELDKLFLKKNSRQNVFTEMLRLFISYLRLKI